MVQKGSTAADKASQAVYIVSKAADEKGKGGIVTWLSYTGSSPTVTIPSTVRLAEGALYKVTAIAADALKNHPSLRKVTTGCNVSSIDNRVFQRCKNLKAVVFGSRLTHIGKKAFYGCSSLRKIVLPARVASIGEKAFYGCSGLKSITVKTLKLTNKNTGRKAFAKTPSNVMVKIPSKVFKRYKKLMNGRGIRKKARFCHL